MNQKLKEQIKAGIRDAFASLARQKKWQHKTVPSVALDIPREAAHGDLATNFALLVAKSLRTSPKEVAQELARVFQEEKIFSSHLVEKTEVAGPGFINFYLANEVLHEELKELLSEDRHFGQSKIGHKTKIHLEFVSANPTGPLNVVSARAAAVGDAIARMFEAVGFEVVREYYVNDAGRQVRLLGQSVEARYRQLLGEKMEVPEEGYHGEYVMEIARKIREKFGKEPLNWPPEEREKKFTDEAIQRNVAGQKEILERYRVHYNNWFSEREMRERHDKPLEKVLEQFAEKNYTYEREGALWFSSTQFADDKDRVLVTQDGVPTYFLADIAYHKEKVKRGFHRMIVLLGPDHHGYYPRILAAMQALGYDRAKFEFRLVQQVNLLRKGEAVKMSKRAGNLVEMRELLDDVGVDAARYFFVLRKLDSHLDFDIDLARQQSADNPVYYVQYAHARISSIFQKFQEETGEKLPSDWSRADFSLLKEKEEVDLMKLLIHFPDLLEGAALAMEPLRLPNYLQELCTQFHVFYTKHRVIQAEKPLREARLGLIQATRIVIRNALELLGVSSPEKM